MKALRIIAAALLLAVISLMAALVLIDRNQRKIAELALAQIQARTGLVIKIAGTRMGLGSHLVVVLERPEVLVNGDEIATLHDIRAMLSYRAIFMHYGLPLARLVLDRPRARLPAAASAYAHNVPRLGVSAMDQLEAGLDALSDTARRVDVVDASLMDQAGAPLIEHFDLNAHRRFALRASERPWRVDFDLRLGHGPFRALSATGVFTLKPKSAQPAAGQIWFWGLDLRDSPVRVISASGKVTGTAALVFDKAGSVKGHSEFTLTAVNVLQHDPRQWLELGDYKWSTSFEAKADRLDLQDIAVRQGAAAILTGSAVLTNPFDDARTLTFDVASAAFNLATTAAWMRTVAGLSPELIGLAEPIAAGQFTLSDAALQTDVPLRDWTPATLRDHLTIEAVIRNASYRLSPSFHLLPFSHGAAQLHFAAGVLKILQGSAMIGAESRLTNLHAEADLLKAPAVIPWKLKLKADFALDELYPAASDALKASSSEISRHVVKLDGRAPLTLESAGKLRNLQWQMPTSYRVAVTLGAIVATLKNAPAPLALRNGDIVLTPELITLNKVRVVPGSGSAGYAIFDGEIIARPSAVAFRDLTAEIHAMRVERWLPKLVSPDSLAANGEVNGKVVMSSATNPSAIPDLDGRLTLAQGDLKLGFIRSPIAVNPATLVLANRQLTLDIRRGILEGAPVDLNLFVADLAHPTLRIDAAADRLDLEALNFIRLPWTPVRPPHFFAAPAYGHIEAKAANFDKLPMTEVATDFSRNSTDWHVYNYTARVLGGRLNLGISGKTGPDNWINMVGKVDGMDASAPFLLSDPSSHPPISGKLAVDANLWADTDVDFFSTLAGTVNFDLQDGVLNRFKLLARILSLIDLKSWLTAQLPNPLLTGIPFKTLSGTLKGARGDFYTDNVRLEGPLMDISSKGQIDFGDGRIDLELGLFPFQTANWIIHHIPLVGNHLANGTQGLVAAYFRVHGPFHDPTVTPKPITSTAEFVKKMLGLPINIIAPNTIK